MALFKKRNMKSNQPDYAERAENFANEPPLQLTLRVLHRIYTSPRFWMGFVAIIVILTITGPFNTLQDLEFAPRLVYWASISLITFPLGMASSVYFGAYFVQHRLPKVVSRLLGGFIGGLPMGVFVWLANKYLFENIVGTWHELFRFTGYTTAISAAVSIIYYLIESSMHPEENQATGSQSISHNVIDGNASPFFKRIPVELGKDIVSLQSQDHYIKVTTTKGSEMILLRLQDAEAELSTIPGLRIHRSWWVARKHTKRLYREDEKLLIELSNGDSVPVSRSYSKTVRAFFND